VNRPALRAVLLLRALLPTALAAILATALVAQPAYLVEDLGSHTQIQGEEWWLAPIAHLANGLLFFFQDDGIHGRELWRSDGTPLGTFRLRDLCPGSCGSRNSYSESAMAASGSSLFFVANDGVHGLELWTTDGTALGTRMVLDLLPGLASSAPRLLTAASGQVFFVAQTAGSSWQLWRSDGNAKGTYRVSLPEGTSDLNPTSIHATSDFVFLCNAGSGGQTGLWRSDGTAQGTSFVAAVACSYGTWLKGAPFVILGDGSLLFAGSDLAGGQELWRSDGTLQGTYRVLDIVPGPDSSFASAFMPTTEGVYFLADDPEPSALRLWLTDGTPGGTQPIDLPDGGSPEAYLGAYTTRGDALYFAAHDDAHGTEPWIVDAGGPRRILDVAPGPDSSMAIDYTFVSFSLFASLPEGVVFTASDGLFGTELWTTDGTEAGTARISDIAPGAEGILLPYHSTRVPEWLLGGKLLFREYQPVTGYRLWSIDGSSTGPELLRTLDSQTPAFEPLGRDRLFFSELQWGKVCFETVQDRLFFEWGGDYLSPLDLWISDGSASGTELRYAGTFGNPIQTCASLGDRLLFVSGEGGARVVYTLGLPPGPPEYLTSSPSTQQLSSFPTVLEISGGACFGLDGDLLQTDGTPDGTTVRAAGVFGAMGWIAPLGSEVVVSAAGLWLTDGNEPNGALALFVDGNAQELAALPSAIVVALADEAHGLEPWITDGTVDGTHLLADILPGSRGSLDRGNVLDLFSETYSPRIASLDSVVVLSADDGSHGKELWATDGTLLFTALLKDIYPGEYPSTPRHLTRLGDRVLFTAEDEEHGLELWTTDGTYEGTHLFKDLAPGAASSVPDDLVVRDGTLYFSAWTPAYGREAWRSDGTPAGTARITDIAPGSLSSSPQRFSRTTDRLYFTATDQVHGFELWAISDDGTIPLFLDGFETSDTSRWSLTEP